MEIYLSPEEYKMLKSDMWLDCRKIPEINDWFIGQKERHFLCFDQKSDWTEDDWEVFGSSDEEWYWAEEISGAKR